MSRRTERLASTIRQEIAQIILREIDDPRIKMLPAITRVEVDEEIANCDIYVSIMGTPGAQTAALNALKHSAGLMRSRLAKMLTIRQMPLLRFKIDEGAKKEIEMLELLHKIEVERLAREAEKAAAAGTESTAGGEPATGAEPTTGTEPTAGDEPAPASGSTTKPGNVADDTDGHR